MIQHVPGCQNLCPKPVRWPELCSNLDNICVWRRRKSVFFNDRFDSIYVRHQLLVPDIRGSLVIAHYRSTPLRSQRSRLESRPVNALPSKLVSAILILVGSGLGVSALPASAEVALPHLFGDNMVLQCDRPIPVWGWSAQGEEVTATLVGETRTAKVGDDGRWKVVLPSLRRDGPLELTVKGSLGSVRVFKNVLLGEVWFCSGQPCGESTGSGPLRLGRAGGAQPDEQGRPAGIDVPDRPTE